MLRYILIFSIIFFETLSSCVLAQPSSLDKDEKLLQIPEEFFVKERWLSWSSSFDVETAIQKLGVVHRRIFSLMYQYDFYDASEKLQATAKTRFTLGRVFDVTDSNENLIGSVHQTYFTFFPTFQIISPDYEIKANAELNFWGTKYILLDPVTDQEIARLTRPFFKFFTDKWTVTITNPELFAQKNIDPRLFVLVMVFQTDRDNWSRSTSKMKMKRDYFGQDELIKLLKAELEIICQSVEKIKPLTEDIVFIENYVEEYFKDLKFIQFEKANHDRKWMEQERIFTGIRLLIPLLSEETLTTTQKSALIYMIEEQLNQIGY